jgi:hypothetical protein
VKAYKDDIDDEVIYKILLLVPTKVAIAYVG